MKKKVLSLLLAAALCLALCPISALAADPASGTCGGNTRWSLQNGVLTISGTGNMADYETYGAVPWYGQRAEITSVVIGADVTSIGDRVFYDCTNLASVSISSGVTKIGDRAFYQCSSLMGVTIPSSVSSIGECAFAYCTNLMGVTIPASVYGIGEGAFRDCTHLVAIQVSPDNYVFNSVDGVLFCRDMMTDEMSILHSYPGGKQGGYTIPDNVTTVGFAAFSGCAGLTSVTIPESVTTIGAAALAGCTALTGVTIPKSVGSISTSVFAGDTGLTAIEVEKGNEYYAAADGVLFCKNIETGELASLAAYPAGKRGAYTIPGSVDYIWAYAFSGCTGLTGVTVPSGVTWLNTSTFWGCTALTSVTLPNSMNNIGQSAFSGCTGLTGITLPGDLRYIGDSAFWGCTGLTGVTIPDGVLSIGSDAFNRCTGLTSVVIPNSVTSIGEQAFWGCTGLRRVDLPNSITRIEPYTFSTCSGLASVTIPDGVVSIGTSAFHSTGLTSVSIPGSVTSIGDHAFRNCRSLTGVVIPNSVTSLGQSAFYECTSLSGATLSAGMTNVEDWTFFGCTNLKSVTIPSSITGIGYAAFWCNDNGSSLKDVYYTGAQYQWNAIRMGEYNQPLTSAAIHYNSTGPVDPAQPVPGNATPTNDALSVDGKSVTPAAYKIGGANYFKLRDVAMMMNGTAAQFSVDYDGTLRAIRIVTGQPYSPLGGELKDVPAATANAEVSNNPLYINGERVDLTAYKINGENYFGIRDLGRALGFNVGWESGRGMFIESNRRYDPNN